MPAPVLPGHPALVLELGQLLLNGLEVHVVLPAVLPLLDASGGAHTQHKVLAAPLSLGDELRLLHDGVSAEDPVDISVQIPFEGVAPPAEVGVGPRPQADVGLAHPVLQIVPGLEARPGEIGDLVLPEARLPKPLYGPEVAVRLRIVVGQRLPLGHPCPERGPLLHLQPVAREVLRLQGQGLF